MEEHRGRDGETGTTRTSPAERARRVVADRVVIEVQERRERWAAEDQRTIREAVDSAAQAARERRQRWEPEYQAAVETWHARELQASQRLSDELESLKAERAIWERRVALLRPQSIDPDMLDERARVLLNYADPRELTLRLKQP